MPHLQLPACPADILSIPEGDIPDVLRTLVQKRELSGLMAQIHGELASKDPSLHTEGRKALLHLGFTE